LLGSSIVTSVGTQIQVETIFFPFQEVYPE
jgi:hypothetical protein